MKKSLSFAIALSSAAMLSASVIDWELPNLVDNNGDLSYDIDDIVFIFDSDDIMSYDSTTGKITVKDTELLNSGSNTEIDTDPLQGTWSDSNTLAGSYYMALKSGSDYYAISDGNDGVMTVEVLANNGNALIPGGSTDGKGTVTFSDAVWTEGSVHTVAPSVPEPATAALAFAGLAMLIRRRKVA